MTYNDKLEAEEQISAEEQIASYLFDVDSAFGQLTEEACNEAGRQILRMVLERFRPDLFEQVSK